MSKKVSVILILYFLLGVVFAFAFALFYRWTPFSYFSPGFYAVILTWPLQANGLLQDFLTYGLAGKPL